jgi:low affinity Fe/Cu permease
MAQANGNQTSRIFADIANWSSRASGKAITFLLAVMIIVIWSVTGPIFGFSDTWQLVINTGTTIVTFLMVFLIQNTQNRDGAAIQVKLDELIRVSRVKNSIIGIEHLTDEELEDLREKCEQRAKKTDSRVQRLSRDVWRTAEKAESQAPARSRKL